MEVDRLKDKNKKEYLTGAPEAAYQGEVDFTESDQSMLSTNK